MPINVRPTLNRIRGIPRKYPTVNRAIETAMRPGDAARRVVADVSRRLGVPIAITSPKPGPRPVPSPKYISQESPRHGSAPPDAPMTTVPKYVGMEYKDDTRNKFSVAGGQTVARNVAQAGVTRGDIERDSKTSIPAMGIQAFARTHGFAIANHFAIHVHPPPVLLKLGNTSGNWLKDINLRAENVEMPGRNLNTTTDSNIYGPTREIVNGAGYGGECAISFYGDIELSERVFFEKWQELSFGNPHSPDGDKFQPPITGGNTWNVKYYKDYIGSIDIYVLNKNDQVEYGIKLWETYPKTINPTTLNHAPNGEVVKIPVTFAYRYWTKLGTPRFDYLTEVQKYDNELLGPADF